MKNTRLSPSIIIITLILLMAISIHAQDNSSGPTGVLYERMDFTVEIDSDRYENPFDETDIALNGIFTSPSGIQYTIPGFWSQPYENTCEQECAMEILEPIGDSVWQVRFTPTETGTWSYTLETLDDGTRVSEQSGTFTVLNSTKSGFITVADNQRYFEYSNGNAYIPIGNNLKWSWDEGGSVLTYQQWLQDLSTAGGNYARLYIDVPWFINLEWEGPAGDYTEAQDEATQLDMILQTAEEEGIKVQLVLLWHQTVSYYNDPPVNIPETPTRPEVTADWDNHPYNFTNGGPLSGPSLFLSDNRALELFQSRIRYIIARWGYSPSVFAWELIDEIDGVFNYEQPTANFWLFTMGQYVHTLDPYAHPVTFGSSTYNPTLASLPYIDFTQSTFYQRSPIEAEEDQVISIEQTIVEQRKTREAPALINAFSLNPWFEPTSADPDGIHFQNSLWTALLSGSAGTAIGDWGSTYVMPQNLIQYYRPIANFVNGINWTKSDFQPAVASLSWTSENTYEPLRVDGFLRQFLVETDTSQELTLTTDGVFPSLETVSSYLYGKVFNNQLNTPQIYHVAVPVDTTLEIGVKSSSNDVNAQLVIVIDGQRVAELDLPPGSRNEVISTPITAGEHTIKLDNLGDDWLELDYIEITDFIVPARTLTLRDNSTGTALAWIQHKDYTWANITAGNTPEPLDLTYTIDEMPTGIYRVEIWNPFTGAVMGEVVQQVGENGQLSVALPTLDSQLALRIFRDTLQSGTLVPTLTPTYTATSLPTETPTITPTSASILITNTPRPTETAVADLPD